MPATRFLIAGFTLVLIDLLLAGDNALVIALAVRSLPRRERRIGSICGAALAVVLRVGLTFVTAKILSVEFVELAGGLFILWIAFKVLIDASKPPSATVRAGSLPKAIWYVVVADITMSTDNILAIAGASGGHFSLILFGLGVSIPFVVLASNLLADLMNRYPAVIYLGAAILGKVGGDMALDDPFMVRTLHPSDMARYAVDAALVVIILAAGWAISKKRREQFDAEARRRGA
jgi:YjbE family integral membrane protein